MKQSVLNYSSDYHLFQPFPFTSLPAHTQKKPQTNIKKQTPKKPPNLFILAEQKPQLI